jgi:hypothetical protein
MWLSAGQLKTGRGGTKKGGAGGNKDGDIRRERHPASVEINAFRLQNVRMERGISWKAEWAKRKIQDVSWGRGIKGKVNENPKILLKDPKYFYPIG